MPAKELGTGLAGSFWPHTQRSKRCMLVGGVMGPHGLFMRVMLGATVIAHLAGGWMAGAVAVGEAGGLRLVVVLALRARLLPGGLLLGSCLGSLMLRCRLCHLLCRLRLGLHLQGLHTSTPLTICFSDVRLPASYIV